MPYGTRQVALAKTHINLPINTSLPPGCDPPCPKDQMTGPCSSGPVNSSRKVTYASFTTVLRGTVVGLTKRMCKSVLQVPKAPGYPTLTSPRAVSTFQANTEQGKHIKHHLLPALPASPSTSLIPSRHHNQHTSGQYLGTQQTNVQMTPARVSSGQLSTCMMCV